MSGSLRTQRAGRYAGKKTAIVAREFKMRLPLLCCLRPGGYEVATVNAAHEEITSPKAAHPAISIQACQSGAFG